LRDEVFFRKSGGGVTISGGEPLFQARFTRSVLALLRERGIHTAIETSGFARWETLESVASYCDLILFDLKHVDPGTHKLWTNVDNSLILDNLRRLSSMETEVVVHLTIVPGFNSDKESIRAIGQFLAKLDRSVAVGLLPFHKLAAGKYERMGMQSGAMQLRSPTPEMMEAIGEQLAKAGVNLRHVQTIPF